jgi:hypothetical protein
MALTQVPGELIAGGTGALSIPVGTTDQRPASPTVGMTRWNTTTNSMEVYIGTGWQTIASTAYSIDYLVVAGGGGGGSGTAGGGGAGGLIQASSIAVSPGTNYVITIGAGATAVVYPNASNSGSNTNAFGVEAIGGGRGGGINASGVTNNPGAGGSGGGQASYSSGTSGSPGAGTAGQGNAGGVSTGGGGGGGGGGAGAAGTANTGGATGGAGLQWSNGTYYAGGGAGAFGGSAASGGIGGGGACSGGSGGTNGVANTGGGGGANWTFTNGAQAGGGGSGVVIVRYLGSTQRATGGTVTITGGYVYHTFTTSGTYIA